MTNLSRAAALGGAALAFGAAYRRYQRVDLTGRSVLISGGSRGLGLEMAREFERKGSRLALLARDRDELEAAREKLTSSDVMLVECDVREAAAVSRAIGEVAGRHGRIDVLVNNAGIIDVAPFDRLDEEDFEDSLETHFWGPLRLIRAAFPHMPTGSRIVNISSIGGLVAIPHLLSYSVGKFALTGLSEGLHAELSQRGIVVTTVCPGLMRTGSHVNARFKGRHEEEFAWFAAAAGFPLTSMNARRAARKIVSACRSGRPFLILTPQARALHLFRAFAPNTMAHVLSLAARLLPDDSPSPDDGDRKKEGWRSTSAAAPSILTKLADRAVRRNNELSTRRRDDYFEG